MGGDENDLQNLVKDLAARSWELRRNAAEDMGDLADTRVIPHLLKALADPVGAVRYAAAASLGKLGDASVAPYLIECLENPGFGTPSPIYEALGNLRVKEAVPYLARGLRDEDHRTRGVANNALMVTTGRSHGFKPGGTAEDREEAVRKWEEWWEENKDTFEVPGRK